VDGGAEVCQVSLAGSSTSIRSRTRRCGSPTLLAPRSRAPRWRRSGR
jgi:hypothetical protein